MIVSSLWVGNEVSPYELACLLSFASHGYKVRIYSYDHSLILPAEIERFDAREIMPENSVWKTPGSSGFAGFSDQFRYELLANEKTLWIDTDMVAMDNALSPSNEYLFGWESDDFINTAVLGLPHDSDLLFQLREMSRSVDLETYSWGQIGPRLLTKIVQELSLQDLALPKSAFYEIGYRHSWKFFHPRQTAFVEGATANSMGVHLWNEFLTRYSSDIKKMAPHPQSFLGRKWRELGISTSGMPIISPGKMKRRWARMLR